MSIDGQFIIGVIKKYAIAIFFVIVSVSLAVYLYLCSDVVSEKKEELEKLNSEVKRLNLNIANSSQLQEQVDFMTKATEAVKARAFRVSGLAENLKYLYSLESGVGIKYKDLRLLSRGVYAKGALFAPISYLVNFEGTYLQVITYLNQLEQGVYFSRITGASISGSGLKISINITFDILGCQ